MGLRERVAEFMGWHYGLVVVEDGDFYEAGYGWMTPDEIAGTVTLVDVLSTMARRLPAWDECRNLAQEVLERAVRKGLWYFVLEALTPVLDDEWYSAHDNHPDNDEMRWLLLTAPPAQSARRCWRLTMKEIFNYQAKVWVCSMVSCVLIMATYITALCITKIYVGIPCAALIGALAWLIPYVAFNFIFLWEAEGKAKRRLRR